MSTRAHGIAFGLLLALAAAGCASQTGPYLLAAPRPIVERYAGDELVVRWDAAPERGPVNVYAGPAPDAIDRTRPVAVMRSAEQRVPGLDPDRRWFFLVEPADGEPVLVAERLLPLEGTHNFRDLGGYRTKDGSRVRWGMVFRSDDLSDLTSGDLRYVSDLEIKLVCDLRGEGERASEPSRLPAESGPEIAEFAIEDERFDPTALRELVLDRAIAGVDFAKLLVEGNRAFVTRFSSQYAAMFKRLSEPGNLPTLVHCTGGKDRTGFASAILLLALGVPEETVFEDYLLTNVYTASYIERTLMLMRIYLFFRTKPEAIRPLLSVRRDYLQAALDEIDKEHGSVEAYLHEGLGLTEAQLARLRELLLVPPSGAAAPRPIDVGERRTRRAEGRQTWRVAE